MGEAIMQMLTELRQKKAVITSRNDEAEISAKVKEYEAQVRAEYMAKKQAELHDLEIEEQAIERVKARLEAEVETQIETEGI